MSTEVAPVEEYQGELLLSETEATALDQAIRDTSAGIVSAADDLIDLLEQAEQHQIHRHFGFDEFVSYAADRLTIKPEDKAQRQLMASIFSASGATERQIAKALGISAGTAHNDLVAAREAEEALLKNEQPEDAEVSEDDGLKPEPKQPSGNQLKVLKAAEKAIVKQVSLLYAEFDGVENLDADVTVEELQAALKALAGEATRINKLKKQFSGWS